MKPYTRKMLISRPEIFVEELKTHLDLQSKLIAITLDDSHEVATCTFEPAPDSPAGE